MDLEAAAVLGNRLDERRVSFFWVETGEANAACIGCMCSRDLVSSAILQLDVNITNTGCDWVVHVRFETAR